MDDDLKNESYQFFTNHIEYGHGVHYAQTFIRSPENKRVVLKFDVFLAKSSLKLCSS